MSVPFRTATPGRSRGLHRLALVAVALAALATLVARPAFEAAGARAMGPLPACRYDDVLTTPRAYADWSITLVDTILRVPKGYVPPDLVPVSQAGFSGKSEIRAVVIEDLRAMREAAAADEAGIAIQSAYRSYAEQKTVFEGWVDALGYERALEVSARPGHSEHQLGLAFDFRSDPGGSPFGTSWGTTPAGKWMAAHAWEYGFLMSYPKGTMAVTCYDYEPWHFRYVGRELAALVHASGLTQREYLWANFTTTVVPPPPAKTAVPGKTAVPVKTTAPTPTPGPSPTATAAPSPAPTATPAATPTATAAGATSTPTPAATPEAIDPDPAAGTASAVLAGVVLLAAVAAGAWLLRRRRPA